MASFYDKVRLRTAVESRNKFDLSHQHITTSDFFQFQPVLSKSLVPNSDITLDVTMFSRMEPLVRPTFGRADVKVRAFFVPYHTVFKGWHDFITDSPHLSSGYPITSSPVGFTLPTFSADQLISLFTEFPALCTITDFLPTDYESADFVFEFYTSASTTETPTRKTCVLTQRGRFFYKLLFSLGYRVPIQSRPGQQVSYSALPLLSLLRVFLDWYYPAAYVGSDEYNSLMGYLKTDVVPNFTLDFTDLYTIIDGMSSVYFDSDYFTSAFDSPLGNNITYREPPVTIVDNAFDISTKNSGVLYDNGVSSSPFLSVNTTTNSFSQYLLNSLNQLTKYFRRNQLAGSRASDKLKARFGIDVGDPNRARYLGLYDSPLQIGDVFATSDNEGASLGDFAGRGYSAGNGHFTCSSGNDYGQLIVISTIIPRTGYYQGVRREVLDIDRLDFFTPEFDALGMQAISKAELFVGSGVDDGKSLGDLRSSTQSIFGFTPRYSHYKTMLDNLSGDFVCNSINQGLDSWHLMRVFGYGESLNSVDYDLVHSLSFIRGLTSSGQSTDLSNSEFDRIFQSPRGNDHFIMFFDFNFKLFSPMKSLYDTYDFDDELNHKEETITVNGGNVN